MFAGLRECFNSRADLTVETSDWNSLVVFRTTPSEINCDATSSEVRVKSEGTLCAELSYATYLAIPAVIIPLQPGGNANLSRIVYNHCAAGASNFQIWMEVPVSLPNETGNGAVNGYGSTANNIRYIRVSASHIFRVLAALGYAIVRFFVSNVYNKVSL